MPPFTFAPPEGFVLVAGPCVLEDDAVNLQVAEAVAAAAERLGCPAVFKGSFDKANRTSGDSPRGPGLEAGLEALVRIRERTGLPVLTDVHLPDQADVAATAVDALQIPAFLSRQTDLLEAAAATGCPVNVKKGQWMAPEDMRHPVAKLRRRDRDVDVAVTERGTAFGYGRWVVDMRSFRVMQEAAGCPALFDATHSVQLPGGGGDHSGGEPAMIEPLALAAVAAGADGLFIETHPNPADAHSDGASVLPLERLGPLVECVAKVRQALNR